ncbi:MAG TPA: pyridoxamine 5'-phosphate oxidase family protein [Candidatus Limnocylindria bacterium]|nr:pyridoxamine 5'-phosphate oxidase family protein [Candidatus Limnocylindria bacterium]
MNQQEISQFIIDNLGRHKLFTLGTIDGQGNPWVVCLALAYDNQLNIIWQSLKNTEHSKHVRTHPDVAICICSDTPEVGDFGLYLKARAREVSDATELKRLLYVRFAAKASGTPDVSNYRGDAAARLYCAEVTKAWINDESHTKRAVDLNLLRQKMSKVKFGFLGDLDIKDEDLAGVDPDVQEMFYGKDRDKQ